VRRGAQVRALVGRAPSVDRARQAGAAEALSGDIRDPAIVREAMRGIDRVVHICPRFDEAEIPIGQSMIAAAVDAGVRHFIYYSVIHGQVDGLPHHRDKRVVEGHLMESPLTYTILQPTMYMQSGTREWKEIVSTGRFRMCYSAETKLATVDLDDVGEATAVVATQPGWEGGCFELCAGGVLTRHEMAKVMSEVTGRAIRAELRDVDEWSAVQREHGHSNESQISRMRAMFAHYHQYGLSGGNGRVLELLLGRRPTTYRQYIERLHSERPNG